MTTALRGLGSPEDAEAGADITEPAPAAAAALSSIPGKPRRILRDLLLCHAPKPGQHAGPNVLMHRKEKILKKEKKVSSFSSSILFFSLLLLLWLPPLTP